MTGDHHDKKQHAIDKNQSVTSHQAGSNNTFGDRKPESVAHTDFLKITKMVFRADLIKYSDYSKSD